MYTHKQPVAVSNTKKKIFLSEPASLNGTRSRVDACTYSHRSPRLYMREEDVITRNVDVSNFVNIQYSRIFS